MNCYLSNTDSQEQGLRVIPQPLPENGSKRLLEALFERVKSGGSCRSMDSVKL